jgi:S-DNA-T family DNA segregation ATPase FtsK/SpoIIIE
MLGSYLEEQARRLENTLQLQGYGAVVTGGAVGPRIIAFNLDLDPSKLPEVRQIVPQIAQGLGVTTVRCEQNEQLLQVQIPHPRPGYLSLRQLKRLTADLPHDTAMCGLTYTGAPLGIRLSARDAAHVLIVGEPGSGKSSLLRVMLTTLRLKNPPQRLRLIRIAPRGSALPMREASDPLGEVVINAPLEGVRTLAGLRRQLHIRRRHEGLRRPRVVVFLDDVLELAAVSEDLISLLAELVCEGHEGAIHLIAATSIPRHLSSAARGLLKIPFPIRITGRTMTNEQIYPLWATEEVESGLLYTGEFIVSSQEVAALRFQVTFVDFTNGRRFPVEEAACHRVGVA